MNNSLKNFLLFLFFFTVTLTLYIQTIHSKFVFDFVDLVFDFQKKGWSNLGSFSSGLSPYLVAKSIFFIVLKFFGFNAVAWYVLSCLLHALNAFLLYWLAERILSQVGYTQSHFAAFLSSLLFLVSPYHTEAIVWSGALNYLIVSTFVLLHLNMVLVFIKTQKNLFLALSAVSFFAAIFSHEWGLFLLPADLLLLFFIPDDFKPAFNKKYWWFVFIILLFTTGYFVNQSIHGSLIGHYGAETHLNFKLDEIVPAFCKYLLKILFLFTLFSVPVQDKVYAFIQLPEVLHSLAFAFVVLFSGVSVLVWRNKMKFGASVFFFLLFCLFVFPVLNLYFPYWVKIHADRYCYLPCAFMYACCIAVLFRWKNFMKAGLPIAGIVVSVFFLLQTSGSWAKAGKLQKELESNFRWWNTGGVYVLNLPDNFRGAYMYRNLQPSALAGTMIKYDYMTPKTEVIEVMNYNLNETDDSVTIERVSDNKLKVTLSKWGIWWWRKTLGATDYETDKVKVDVDDYGHSYLVEFKQKQADDVFLYQANGKWREVQNF